MDEQRREDERRLRQLRLATGTASAWDRLEAAQEETETTEETTDARWARLNARWGTR